MIVERIPLTDEIPFDVQEVALHARVDGEPELMSQVLLMGRSAAAELEEYAQIALLFQTVRITLPQWSGGQSMPLPVGPVVKDAPLSVTVNGQAVAGASLVAGKRPGIQFANNLPPGLIVIEYRAGFGEHADSIPPDLAHAIIEQVQVSMSDAGLIKGTKIGMSPHMARIASRYRRVRL